MSEEKVFETVETIGATDDLMSFDGCPNRCRNGYYVDPYLHRRVRCEHCFELRKKLVAEKIQVDSGRSVVKTLRLQETFMGYGNFDVETIFHKTELRKYEDWSVSFVKSVLQRMLERVSLGEPVVPSILINLGRRAHSQNFASPFLVRSYISGVSTAPFLSSLDVQRLRMYPSYQDMPEGWRAKYAGMSFDELLTPDTCLVYLDAGGDDKALMAVKGLMQLRAWNDKSTVILTDYYSDRLYDLVEDVVDARVTKASTNTSEQSVDVVAGLVDGTVTSVKDLAVLVGIHYKKNVKVDDVPTQYGSDMSKADVNALTAQTKMAGIQ